MATDHFDQTQYWTAAETMLDLHDRASAVVDRLRTEYDTLSPAAYRSADDTHLDICRGVVNDSPDWLEEAYGESSHIALCVVRAVTVREIASLFSVASVVTQDSSPAIPWLVGTEFASFSNSARLYLGRQTMATISCNIPPPPAIEGDEAFTVSAEEATYRFERLVLSGSTEHHDDEIVGDLEELEQQRIKTVYDTTNLGIAKAEMLLNRARADRVFEQTPSSSSRLERSVRKFKDLITMLKTVR